MPWKYWFYESLLIGGDGNCARTEPFMLFTDREQFVQDFVEPALSVYELHDGIIGLSADNKDVLLKTDDCEVVISEEFWRDERLDDVLQLIETLVRVKEKVDEKRTLPNKS